MNKRTDNNRFDTINTLELRNITGGTAPRIWKSDVPMQRIIEAVWPK